MDWENVVVDLAICALLEDLEISSDIEEDLETSYEGSWNDDDHPHLVVISSSLGFLCHAWGRVMDHGDNEEGWEIDPAEGLGIFP